MGITTYSSTFALSGGGGRSPSHDDRGAPPDALPREGPAVRPGSLERLLDRTCDVKLETSESSPGDVIRGSRRFVTCATDLVLGFLDCEPLLREDKSAEDLTLVFLVAVPPGRLERLLLRRPCLSVDLRDCLAAECDDRATGLTRLLRDEVFLPSQYG